MTRTQKKVAIGAGVVVGVGLIAYFLWGPSPAGAAPALPPTPQPPLPQPSPTPPPSPPPTPPGPQPIDITHATTQLTPGHRYKLVVPDLTGSGAALTLSKLAAGFDIIFGAGALVPQSINDDNGALTVVFDYTGGIPLTVGIKDLRFPSGTLLDLGPTPV